MAIAFKDHAEAFDVLYEEHIVSAMKQVFKKKP